MKKMAFFPMVVGGLAGAFLLIAAGCGTPDGPRDLMMEEATSTPVERPVAMKGEATFHGGKVGAVATVSRGFERPRAARRGPRGEYDGEGRRRRDEGGMTQVYMISGDTEEEQKEAMEEYIRQAKARRAAGSPMPPVTLRVELENRGSEPIEVEVTEVNSSLGNFAVRPPRLSLAAGEKGLLEPMISQLGVTSDEIPLTLAVRVGGRKESQVVVVKNIIAASLRKEFETMQGK